MTDVKRRLLGMLAIASALVSAVLACGYVSWFACEIDCYKSAAADPPYRAIVFGLSRGRVFARSAYWDTPGRPYRARMHFLGPGVGAPDEWLWGFVAERVVGINSTRLFIFAFPNWCVLLPCLIPPLLWLRRRRRATQRGFPIDHATISSSATI
jgi:hypothetical protein